MLISQECNCDSMLKFLAVTVLNGSWFVIISKKDDQMYDYELL